MVCYHPLDCVYPIYPDDEGKRHLNFKKSFYNQFTDLNGILFPVGSIKATHLRLQVPCGQCIGCKMDYSRMWALRSVNEATTHKKNTFLTLTFNNKYVHNDGSVHKEFLSSWIKRFRYYYGDDIRFLCVGEYGGKSMRPHYHILFYNFDFDDKYVFQYHKGTNVCYYRSPFLENKVWTDVCSKESLGYSIIGEVNFQTSAYVARYCTKKIFPNRKTRLAYFKNKQPEFLNFSRQYGIGLEYFLEHHTEELGRGYSTLRNGDNFVKLSLPRYYLKIAEKYFPSEYYDYKARASQFLIENLLTVNDDKTTPRLQVREELQKLKVDKLTRSYDLMLDLHNI